MNERRRIMGTIKRRYPKEEIAKRGEAIFEKEVRAQLKGRDPMEFVVIDIETRAYEVDADNLIACLRLRERYPDAQIWGRQVGSRAIRHFGGRVRPEMNGRS
jgi:hypothetical protein